MADFHRTNVNDRSFIRGAARLLVAPMSEPFPAGIGDIIALEDPVDPETTPLKYDALGSWIDLGATKTGIQITINNAEESFDIDQSLGDIASQPTNWECSVGTQLAEFTPEKMQIAWEGGAIGTNADGEDEIGFGTPVAYTQRRLAVLYPRPKGTIRAYVFRKVQRMPQESSVTHAKTGDQISIPVRFRALPDTTHSEVQERFFMLWDQETAA